MHYKSQINATDTLNQAFLARQILNRSRLIGLREYGDHNDEEARYMPQ
jgi:hypothetical protein